MRILRKVCATVMIFCVFAFVWLLRTGGEKLGKEQVTLTGDFERTVSRAEFIAGAAGYFLPGECPEEAVKAVCAVVSTRLERGDATGFSLLSGTDAELIMKTAKEYGSLVLFDERGPLDTGGFNAQELCRLAAEGYSCTELLGHFYPGAVLKEKNVK